MTTYKWGRSALRARMLQTGQLTTYVVNDDGNNQKGIAKKYTVYTTGAQSGTTNLSVAHYANNGISFTAPATISDAGGGFATILTNDLVYIVGSGSNDGIYTVTAGGVAGSFTVNPAAIINEGAGAYVKIYKYVAVSNNVVLDCNTGLMWGRYTTTGLKIGAASTGLLNWYDATTCFTLHPAAADLQIIAAPSNILRIVGGAAEATRYHVGDVLDFTGFANADNNLPGYRVLSVTVNGADLDIVLDPVRSVLVAEAAGGSRSILLVCRSCFTYCAAANAAIWGGYSDWRIPNDVSLMSLRNIKFADPYPDSTAFPGWATNAIWSSLSRSNSLAATQAKYMAFAQGNNADTLKTVTYAAMLVRGGV
jgi:hypothetical protein